MKTLSVSLIVIVLASALSECSKRPNIVVIMADDLGWNDVSYHGSSQISTPNVDALGYNGIIMKRHYSQQSCTPSRAAFLTGQYPIRTGFQGFPSRAGENRTVDHSFKTLPEELRKLGYKTHMVGKWHLGYGYLNATPLYYGYQSHYGYYSGYISYYDHSIQEFDNYRGIDFYDNLQPIDVKGHATDLFTQRSLKVIKDHAKNEDGSPLFLVINHLAGHTGKTVSPDHTVLEVENITKTNEKYSHISDPTRRMLAEIVEHFDWSIGQVVTTLKESKMLEDTIVLIMSDNGAPSYGLHSNAGSNWPLRGQKMSLFEGGVRTFCNLYYSKLKSKGRVYDGLFHISDWVPTLYSAAGGNINVFGPIDGIDQWNNLLNNRNNPQRTDVLLNIDERIQNAAYIDSNGRYKLIINSTFFDDYSGDPGVRDPSAYDTHKAIFSDVNEAINENFYDFLTYTMQMLKFRALRKSVSMENCRADTYSNCSSFCLFDLSIDPCETTDIAQDNPAKVAEMMKKIREYEGVMVPQQLRDVDPNADPANCRGFWYSWLEGPTGCWFNR